MNKLLLLALLAAPLFAQTANTTIQPDCLIPFTLTAAGNAPAATVAGAPNDNRTKGCAAWTLMYQSTGLTMVTVTLQSASTTGTSPSYGSFAGTISTGFANPIVSDTGGSVQAVNGTADISWVRVNVAATGSGTLTGVLYGFRNSSAAVNGGGGTCPVGAAGYIQYYVSTGLCGGSADFTRDLVTGAVRIRENIENTLYVGPDQSTLDPYLQGFVGQQQFQFTAIDPIHNQGTAVGIVAQSNLSGMSGAYNGLEVAAYGVITGNVTESITGVGFAAGVVGTGNVPSITVLTLGLDNETTGTVPIGTSLSIGNAFNGGGGILTNNYAIKVEDQTAGVSNWAIKTGLGVNYFGDTVQAQGYLSSDASVGTTGNGFKNGLCVTASGACVGGAAFPAGTTTADIQCWASATTFRVCNNTTIAGRATEGSATLTADVVNPFINAKNTQSATAPGAAKCDLRVIAGTNAGTGKIVINCGTSATEVTIADNIGAAF